ncbi:MFS transporter [Paenibacillus hubeiensis]|uniref:MFS transporter n=1 Tax=Paenibacillus hubeiensis TaxID=3077330 RepID=UPI0031BAE5EC
MNTVKPQLARTSEIIRYSFGGFASNILFYLQLAFLMYFYTDVFGVSPTTVGTLFLLVRVVDALADPFIGMLSDRTRTKYGKYRPYLIFGAPLLAAATLLMFTAPELNAQGKIIYAAFTYLAYSLISSLVNVPYHSLTAIMSTDQMQTTTISTAKTFMGLPAQILVNASVLPMVAFFGDGQRGWFVTVTILSLLSIISYWICASGAKRQDTIENTHGEGHQHPSIKTQLSLIFKNKPLLILMLSMFMNLVATTTYAQVSVYFWEYNLGHKELYSQISLWGLILSIPIYLITPYLSKKIGKRNIFLIGSIASAIPTLILMIAPYDSVTTMFVASVLKTILGTFAGAIVWAMIPDCVEYGKRMMGLEGAGTVTSSIVFVNKLGSAIGGVLAAFALGAVGYVAGQIQSETVLDMIRYLYAGIPLVAYIATAIALKFYKL